MPDTPAAKPHVHPLRSDTLQRRAAHRSHTTYAELQATSNFTFLTGASHPEEIVERASQLGLRAIAITDRNTLGGVVRAHIAARQAGIQFLLGCRLDFFTIESFTNTPLPHAEKGEVPIALSVLVYPTTRQAYGGLCKLLTLGKRRAPKGQCHLALPDLLDHQEGLLAVLVPPARIDGNEDFLCASMQLRRVFDADRLSLAVPRRYGEDDRKRMNTLAALGRRVSIPLVATNDVHYHDAGRRALQDVLVCIRHGCAIDEAGFRLFPHGERYLKSAEQMTRLFSQYPEALNRSTEIAERASTFSLDSLRYQYPDATVPPGRTEIEHLQALTLEGAMKHYPDGIPESIAESIQREIEIIGELNYAPYFLTIHELVRFARNQEILCQGRGAAANSAVCYCLGITGVDPAVVTLLFERFVSRERNEPPDIDIDFEHERREEVIQHVYCTYGRGHAALTAEIISYRSRSALRDVGKALGMSPGIIDQLSKKVDWISDGPISPQYALELGLDPKDENLARWFGLASDLLGFPRHRSQHVGGFVITRDPLSELVPIENCAMEDRTVIEWDKDDIAAMGILKVDLLALGMLTAIRKTFDFIEVINSATSDNTAGGFDVSLSLKRFKREGLTPHTLPPEDPAVYDMICEADTIGVFQVESRAQMSMLPRLKPRCFYDLVIEVAIVRPGPIHGGMVHPYIRRRNGEEPVESHGARVDAILSKTKGVPLFQEQAMALAIEAAGFTPGEADALRRAMASWKRKTKEIRRFGDKLIHGMEERGYSREFAERCFKQIQGFSEYGFPESHAASFALIVYVSAWLKHYHPAAFTAALLNSQPMGFYAPAQLVRDAREHGVEVRPIDVNHSAWDATLECAATTPSNHPAIRLGFRQVKGLTKAHAQSISDAVEHAGPFESPEALHRASRAPLKALRRLASADAFNSMGLERQEALWRVRSLRDEDLPLFSHLIEETQPKPALPVVSLEAQVTHDYVNTRLSLKAHPVSFLRDRLIKSGVMANRSLRDQAHTPHGQVVQVAGIVLARQRPSTAKGIVFITIEDETGIANLILKRRVFDQNRRVARDAVALGVRGVVERKGAVVHVMAEALVSLEIFTDNVLTHPRNFH